MHKIVDYLNQISPLSDSTIAQMAELKVSVTTKEVATKGGGDK